MPLIGKYIKSLRLSESVAMSGFFLVGGIFAVSNFNYENMKLFFYASLMSVLLIVSIYAFNALGGFRYDKWNFRLKHMTLKSHQYLILSVLFLLTATSLGFCLSTSTGFIALLIFGLWMLYSFPLWGLKHKPFWGTVLHFFAQILHFLLIYSVFCPINLEAFLISIYFSLIFSAGHLFHEIIDYEPDKKSGLKTGAIVMGIDLSQNIIIIIFSMAAIYWLILFWLGSISLTELLCFDVAYVFQLIVWLFYRGKFIDIKARIQYRLIYRVLYCFSGLIIIISKM